MSTPLLDSLESRRLFSVTIDVVDLGVGRLALLVTSDDAADQVTASIENPGAERPIEELNFRLNYNDTQQSFVIGDYARIAFVGNGGADSFILGNVPLPLLAFGGKGHDTISASTGNDSLYGEGGEDYLFGDSGDDVLDGGLQGDEMIGREGNDYLYGGSSTVADDVISGGSGYDVVDFSKVVDGRVRIVVGNTEPGVSVSDVVYGDVEEIRGTAFDDIISTVAGKPIKLNGSAGVDRLYGGSKNDTLIGGAGSDYLYGNGGDDLLDAGGSGGGADRLFGGTGTDRVIGRTGNDVLDSVEMIG